MHQRPFKQIDVFSGQPGHGNPVAVVLDAQGLSEQDMRRFAAWTNLSETTFLLPPTAAGQAAGADYRLRIFSPRGELPFAGHPTLGTCHAWLQAGHTPRQPGLVIQESALGLVRIERGPHTLAFAAPPLTRTTPDAAHLAAVLGAMGLAPAQVKAAQSLNNGPEWLGLLLDSPDTVLALSSDHAALRALNQKVGVAALQPATPDLPLIARSSREARAFATSASATSASATGMGVADSHQPGDEPDLWVRAFAAPVGVDEDPVTGSLNASLAQWLMADGLLPAHRSHAYTATQGQALGRDGLVFLSRDDSGQVWVGGDVSACIQGTVTL